MAMDLTEATPDMRAMLDVGIGLRTRYKKAIEHVFRYCVELEYGNKQPSSMKEVMSEVKQVLDLACVVIDEVCAQGVFDLSTATSRKERLFRAILRSCIAKGLLQKPEDPNQPANETLGYEMPDVITFLEGRPGVSQRLANACNTLWSNLRSLLQTQAASREAQDSLSQKVSDSLDEDEDEKKRLQPV